MCYLQIDTTKHVSASPPPSGLNSVAPTENLDTLTNFLMQTGSGNCFLRALSRQLTGSQELHLPLRETLMRFEADNPEVFSSLLSSTTLDNHMSRVGADRAWGSSIEIAAAA